MKMFIETVLGIAGIGVVIIGLFWLVLLSLIYLGFWLTAVWFVVFAWTYFYVCYKEVL